MERLDEAALEVRIKDDILLNAVETCLFGMVCFIGMQLGVSDRVPELMSGLVLLLGSWHILHAFRKSCRSWQFFWILSAGYLLRVLCLFLDLYGGSHIPIPHGGTDSDSVQFYRISIEYYQGIYKNYSTNYPHVIRWIYGVFGQNRFIAQYVNVFFWFLTALVVIRACESFGSSERQRLVPCMVLAFWPNWVFLSSILLRESIQIFFITLSFCLFLTWMRSGKAGGLVFGFLLVLPAMFLHMASVAVWVAYAVVLSVWSVEKQKMVLCFGRLLKLFFLLVLLAMLFVFTPLRGIVLSKASMEFSLQTITHRSFNDGGSDYLREMDCQYWHQFLAFTAIRMFYFLFSPLPKDFRGAADLMAFLADSFSIFVLIGCTLWNMKRNRRRRGYAAAGLFVCMMLAGIFAWGTSNAGTAMRHRTKMIGVLAMSYCLSMKPLERIAADERQTKRDCRGDKAKIFRGSVR